MPDAAVESFAGVANPFSLRRLGSAGHVVGIDMLAEMLAKSRESARRMGLQNVEFREAGGRLQFADIANGEGWRAMLRQTGFVDIETGPRCDTFGAARGEKKARLFEVYGHAFLARKPGWGRPEQAPKSGTDHVLFRSLARSDSTISEESRGAPRTQLRNVVRPCFQALDSKTRTSGSGKPLNWLA
jgi:hypothetical protein